MKSVVTKTGKRAPRTVLSQRVNVSAIAARILEEV